MSDLLGFLMLGTILASVLAYALFAIPVFLYELHQKSMAKEEAKLEASRPRGGLKALLGE